MNYDAIIVRALADFRMPDFGVGGVINGPTPEQKALLEHFERVFLAGEHAFHARFAKIVHQLSGGLVTLVVNPDPHLLKGPGIYFKLLRGSDVIAFAVGPYPTPFVVMHH